MGLLAWIVVGLIAGYLAGIVMKGRGSGLVNDIILGVIGAVVGGYLASVLLKMPDAVNGINVTSIVVAFIGAMIVIVALRALAPRRGLWRR